MTKTITTLYNVAEHLRTPEEIAAYLEACLEEADGDTDTTFIANALEQVRCAIDISQTQPRVKIPNVETLAAMQELIDGGGEIVANVDELFAT